MPVLGFDYLLELLGQERIHRPHFGAGLLAEAVPQGPRQSQTLTLGELVQLGNRCAGQANTFSWSSWAA